MQFRPVSSKKKGGNAKGMDHKCSKRPQRCWFYKTKRGREKMLGDTHLSSSKRRSVSQSLHPRNRRRCVYKYTYKTKTLLSMIFLQAMTRLLNKKGNVDNCNNRRVNLDFLK